MGSYIDGLTYSGHKLAIRRARNGQRYKLTRARHNQRSNPRPADRITMGTAEKQGTSVIGGTLVGLVWFGFPHYLRSILW
jgi:hypothetical protein